MTEDSMKAIQYLETPAGRLVVLPETEYERLVDAASDALDKAAVRTFRTRLAAGEEELLPAAMVQRMLEGESPVRVWREHRGIGSAELAKRAELSSAFVSQIEAGKRRGSTATLRRIAEVLGVTVDDLV